jgi:hypothetical protein
MIRLAVGLVAEDGAEAARGVLEPVSILVQRSCEEPPQPPHRFAITAGSDRSTPT